MGIASGAEPASEALPAGSWEIKDEFIPQAPGVPHVGVLFLAGAGGSMNYWQQFKPILEAEGLYGFGYAVQGLGPFCLGAQYGLMVQRVEGWKSARSIEVCIGTGFSAGSGKLYRLWADNPGMFDMVAPIAGVSDVDLFLTGKPQSIQDQGYAILSEGLVGEAGAVKYSENCKLLSISWRLGADSGFAEVEDICALVLHGEADDWAWNVPGFRSPPDKAYMQSKGLFGSDGLLPRFESSTEYITDPNLGHSMKATWPAEIIDKALEWGVISE